MLPWPEFEQASSRAIEDRGLPEEVWPVIVSGMKKAISIQRIASCHRAASNAAHPPNTHTGGGEP
jgi:hypothetical protein